MTNAEILGAVIGLVGLYFMIRADGFLSRMTKNSDVQARLAGKEAKLIEATLGGDIAVIEHNPAGRNITVTNDRQPDPQAQLAAEQVPVVFEGSQPRIGDTIRRDP